MGTIPGFPFGNLRPQTKTRVWEAATFDTPQPFSQALAVETFERQPTQSLAKVGFSTQKTFSERMLDLAKNTKDLSQDEIDNVLNKLTTSKGELTGKDWHVYGGIQEILGSEPSVFRKSREQEALQIIKEHLKPASFHNTTLQTQKQSAAAAPAEKHASTVVESDAIVEHWDRVAAETDQFLKESKAFLEEMAAKYSRRI